MATGYTYTAQFDGKPAFKDDEIHMIPVAEDLAAFLLNNERKEYEGKDQQLIRLLPQLIEKFPGTITCVQTYEGKDREKPYLYTWPDRSELRGIHDDIPEYRSSLSWIVAINDITAYWSKLAFEADLLAAIRAADIPEVLREYLIGRYLSGERVDYREAKEGFKPRDGKYSIASYQHAWSDEHISAFIVDGIVKTESSSYSIGD